MAWHDGLLVHYAPTPEAGRQRRALGKSLQHNKVRHCTVRPIDESQGQTPFLHNQDQRNETDERGQGYISVFECSNQNRDELRYGEDRTSLPPLSDVSCVSGMNTLIA